MIDEVDGKAKAIKEWEARQSPVGFYILALSYLETADHLTSRIHETDKEQRLDLSFDSPVRHLYAQTWELALKACLFAQGIRPQKLKTDFGHRLDKAWKHVDRQRFAFLYLDDATKEIAEHLGSYHHERQFAYPSTGIRQYLPLNYIKNESKRFRIDRIEIVAKFQPHQDLK